MCIRDSARRYQHASEVKSQLKTIAEAPAPAAVSAAHGPDPGETRCKRRFLWRIWPHGAIARLALVLIGLWLFQQFALPMLKPLFAKRSQAQSPIVEPASGILFADLPGRGRVE